ncbi:SorT family sulfite dehydrogenase catalytic subunit [Chelativorans sp. YIM 93263]|uniref:SorT family sulfite dehydrogenase catalytic subunit n=1 Tax=Chelativorans sp. YIM 93263 TaxID=2906648 RepID=UPI002378E570|nr:sulfite oxidase [Chelativorans sp. YIM 93263]
MLSIPRRHFLIAAAGTAGAAASSLTPLGSRPALAQESENGSGSLPEPFGSKIADSLIVHSELTLETERDAIGTSGITAKDILYVRNNLPTPSEEIVADPDAWEVQIEGVREPRSVTVGELKSMGVETVSTVLQCSGNGRGFFDHETSGSQWLTGAAGNLLWSGVPVRDVVEALGGLEDGRNFMTSTGGEDLPEGVDESQVVVERSIPVDHAMEHGILAWEMNGEPVPLIHGGPLRVVIPGYYGINNVKYVRRVAFTEEESDASIMRTSYRVRPVGVEGAPDQPSMWEMKVKSWITRPLADVESGRVLLYGVAFGGINALERVEVSTDGGENWQEARLLGPDLGRFAWQPFVLSAELEPGTYTVTSRATDSEGRVQEEVTEPNHRGYDYSGWRVLAVDVTVV